MSNRITRRKVLTRGLAGLTVVVAGGVVWRAWDNGVFNAGEGPAYHPWRDWREARLDGPMALIQAGILAANAHNSQPWRFHVGDNQIALYADADRHLGALDPFRREMMLSLGCVLENMAHSATAEGIKTRIEAEPGRLLEGQLPSPGKPVAVVRLSAEEARKPSPLHDAIAKRHTNRGAYIADQAVGTAGLEQMRALNDDPALRLFLIGREPERSHLGELIVAATEEIIADTQMAGDSARWFRFDRDAIDRHRDGITLDASGLPPVINAAAKILPPPSDQEADKQWLTATKEVHVATAPLLGMIAVRDLYDRPTALAAGRLWQRLHLWATAQGLAAHPLNQPPEMVDRERMLDKPPRTAEALAQITGDADWRPTFIFRLGHAERQALPSPRRPIDAVVARS